MEEPTVKNPNLGYLKAVKVFGILSILLALGCAGLLAIARQNAVKAIDMELAKAKAAGMLTSVQDIERMLGPRLTDADNAAPIYVEMSALTNRLAFGEIPKARQSLLENPTEKNLAYAKRLLQQHSKILELAVEAGQRPSFHYDHDWSLGYSMPVPYYGAASNSASLLILRALVSELESRDSQALADLKTVRTIAGHMRQGAGSLSDSTSIIMVTNAATVLAKFAGVEPTESIWIRELVALEDSLQVPTLQELADFDLFCDLMLYESVRTAEGREKQLGRDLNSKIDLFSRVRSAAMPPDTGLLSVISARMEIWKELGKGEPVDWTKVALFDKKVNLGFSSNAYLKLLLDGFGSFDTRIIEKPRQNIMERKMLIQAAIRVLRQKDRTKMPSFADLISPIDGLPIRGAVVGDSVILSSVDTPQTAMPRSTFSFRIRK